MYRKTYYATSPRALNGISNQDIVDQYLIDELFAYGEIRLNYLHYERMIIGGASPTSGPISLPAQTEPESAKGKPFLERRELGVVNVGGVKGSVTVDGERFELAPMDGLYVPMGSSEVIFESADSSELTRFYLVSTPAHARFDTKHIDIAAAVPLELFINISSRQFVDPRSFYSA
jgi:4-deoxy-L-threo-5-hexosulose-uronate ketol-isomerase